MITKSYDAVVTFTFEASTFTELAEVEARIAKAIVDSQLKDTKIDIRAKRGKVGQKVNGN